MTHPVEHSVDSLTQGIEFRSAERYEEAVQALKKALEVDPSNPVTYTALALTLRDLNEFEEGLAICEKGLELDPSDAAAQRLRGVLLSALGRLEAAQAAYQCAIDLRPDLPENHLSMALTWFRLRKYDIAAACAERAAQLQPRKPLPRYIQGIALIEAGRPELVRAILDQVEEKHSTDYELLGLSLLRCEEYDKGIQALQRALELQPKTPRLLRNMASAYAALRRFGEAQKACRQAIRIAPDDGDNYQALAIVLWNRHKRQDALRACRRAIELDPGQARHHHVLSTLLWNLDRHREAVEACQDAVDLDPREPRYCHSLGTLLFQTKRAEQALRAHQKAIDLDPDAPEYLAALADVLQDVGRIQDAQTTIEQALRLAPDCAQYHLRLGVLQYLQERTDQCLDTFRAIVQMEPDYPDAHNNLGFVLTGAGKYDEAMDELRLAQELGYDIPEVTLTNLGYIHFKRGEHEPAIACLEQVLDQASEDSRAILRVVFHQQQHTIVRETPYPRRILPVLTAAFCNLAAIYALLGDLGVARDMATEAIYDAPDNPMGYRARGHIYLESGWLKRSLKAFRRAHELDDTDLDSRRCVEYVEGLLDRR